MRNFYCLGMCMYVNVYVYLSIYTYSQLFLFFIKVPKEIFSAAALFYLLQRQ